MVDLIQELKSGLKVKTSSTQWVWSYLWLLLFLKADQKFNFCFPPEEMSHQSAKQGLVVKTKIVSVSWPNYSQVKFPWEIRKIPVHK